MSFFVVWQDDEPEQEATHRAYILRRPASGIDAVGSSGVIRRALYGRDALQKAPDKCFH